MKLLVPVIACTAVLAFTGMARAQTPGFALVGYHASPDMQAWAAASDMPLPPSRVWVSFGDPVEYGPHLIYLPSCCTEGWTHHAIHGLLYHELGHVYDDTVMTPALRRAFRESVGIPATSAWYTPIATVRWVVGPDYIVKIAPSEMFAEEYAACSLGLTQRGYQDAGYMSYGWVPPQGTDETALCALIASAV